MATIQAEATQRRAAVLNTNQKQAEHTLQAQLQSQAFFPWPLEELQI